MMMARFIPVSSCQFRFSCRELPPSSSALNPRRSEVSRRKFPIKCSSSEPEDGVDSVSINSSTYSWFTGLGGIGMLDTAYLTYLKLTGSDAFCPVGGGTCGDVLNSDYALVFGVPLPVIGFVMYGLVTALSAQLAEGNLPFGVSKTNGRFALFAATTTMASASAYFLYILSTKLSGSSCLYCLVSAFLSFTLFFLALKDVKMQEIQQVVGLQICLALIVVASLTASYSTAQPIPSSCPRMNESNQVKRDSKTLAHHRKLEFWRSATTTNLLDAVGSFHLKDLHTSRGGDITDDQLPIHTKPKDMEQVTRQPVLEDLSESNIDCSTTPMMMARFIPVSSCQFRFSFRELPPSSSALNPRRFEVSRRRFPIKCSSSESDDGVDLVSINSSTYSWFTGLGGIGMLDTAYLTYLKLTGSDAFCPVGGGTCGDVLNSDYALVFGVPLPVIGFVMYGLVTALSAQLAEGNLPFGVSKTNGRFALFAATTTMASASAYFLYILSTKLSGSSCLYCLVSAFLSFTLFFLALKDVKMQEIQQVVGLQICLALIVVASLTASYSTAQPIPSREAAKLLNYVECFPEGYKKGTKIFKACSDVGIEGFPTWMINGQVLSGEVELAELAEMSGFSLDQAKPLQ
ncbi:hypothetical protein F2Q69_00032808 [Brassica cretica]|uniref:Vitamin K epoxide reductase domain-containing protein n=1 Tax=Brassica cretica TaxID=69181 RepID=A0A8S9SHX6_BRACR|nr:hypothetical protein F2Q69_00032808 [Brassica cretica]